MRGRLRTARRRRRRRHGRLRWLAPGGRNGNRFQRRLLSRRRRSDRERLGRRRGGARRGGGGRGLVEGVRFPESVFDLFDRREEGFPRTVREETVPRVLVGVRGHPVEGDDPLLGRRLGHPRQARYLVIESLAMIGDFGDRRVGVGERLLKGLAGVVQRFELRLVDDARRRRRRRGLRERHGRHDSEQESAGNDLHAVLLAEDAIIALRRGLRRGDEGPGRSSRPAGRASAGKTGRRDESRLSKVSGSRALPAATQRTPETETCRRPSGS